MDKKNMSFISEDVVFDGEIDIKDELLSEGSLKGEIKGSVFKQDKKGSFEGSLKVEKVMNEGSIKGSVVTKEIYLKKGSTTEADIQADSIVIDKDSAYNINAKNKS